MLVMMAVGIPIYVYASASVPLAAAGLATIWNTLGRRTAILYLLAVAGCALGAGLLLDALVYNTEIKVISHAHQMVPPLVQNLAAVALLALLAYAFVSRRAYFVKRIPSD